MPRRCTRSDALRSLFGLARRFGDDTSGAYAVMAAIALPALLSAAGLGAEAGLAYYRHASAQAAADAAAISAAKALAAGWTTPSQEAKGIAAVLGFTHGVNGVTVTVNNPPTSGSATTDATAIEVLVKTTQKPYLMAALRSPSYSINGRSVASSGAGSGCVLALNSTASGSVTLQGNPSVTLNNCTIYDNSSSASALSLGGSASLSATTIAVVGGISGSSHITALRTITGTTAQADPYSSVAMPSYSGCDQTGYSTTHSASLSPGVYCNGIDIKGNATVTLSAGTYIIAGGSFTVNGNASVTGTGVTLVFTKNSSGSYATAKINGGATINLTAPTTGSLTGIVVYGDRTMPAGTSFDLGGGSSQIFGGAVYLPKAALSYGGGTGSSGCTQIVADTISFSGSSSLAISCTGYGTTTIGSATKLVE